MLKRNVLLFLLTFLPIAAIASAPLPADTPWAHYVAVSVETYDHMILSGHLALPKSVAPPYPAILLLVGSGPVNRYENVPGNITADGLPAALFQPIEQALVKQGIAVMAYDKRGVHPRDNTFLVNDMDWSQFYTSTADNLAADAIRAFDVMVARREINSGRVGVLGHSEGIILALKVAERHPEKIRALFMLGLEARSMTDNFYYQNVTNPMRLFFTLDTNGNGYVEQEEYAAATSSDPVIAQAYGNWSDLLAGMDKTGDGKISEQEWRYFFEMHERQTIALINDPSKPWPAQTTPRKWFQQYFAEGPYLDRELKFCPRIHLFQGQIDVQTPFEDGLQLSDGCQNLGRPLASYLSYPDEGHAFSPRIGYKKVRDTVGPMDPKVPVDIANQAAQSL